MGRPIFLLCLIAILAASCENEVDLNAPEKDITAAYGVLDGGDSLHYVKVNQAFLPEGNVETYASERADETIYENISVSILELEEGDEVRRSFSLRDTLLEKEDGLFKSDEMQTLYYFTATDLDPEYRYRLQVLVNEGQEDEKKVTGECELVGDFGITSHNPNVQFGGEFFLYTGSKYNENFKIQWSEIENASDITLHMMIHVREIFSNGDTTDRTIDWRVGSTDGDNEEMRVGGEPFYRMMGNTLSGDKSGLDKRRFKGIDLHISAEEEEIRTYQNVAGASGSIVQHRPQYSNLEPDAVGVFGSVRNKDFTGFNLTDNSLEHLIEGELTSDLKFDY